MDFSDGSRIKAGAQSMLVNTEHLMPGMELDKDIELKAGSYLITRRDLEGGRLNDRVIESIQKFSTQIVPHTNRVFIKDDKLALGYVKKVLEEDLKRIAEGVTSGKSCPNFLAEPDIQIKVLRVMEILFSNPDIIRAMYDFKFNFSGAARPLELILEHSIRVTLLSIALGLRMGWTIIALVSVGTAALLHDMGILCTPPYPEMESLDELPQGELASFIQRHQAESARLFSERQLSMSPYHQAEISHILASHHSPDPDDTKHRSTMLFYFADLLDEMISPMPHRVRYNFTAEQLKLLGPAFSRRTGLVNLFLGLTRLYKKQDGLVWEIVLNLAGLFRMQETISGEFEEKLQKIIDWCPFDSAKAYPSLEGNSVPRTVYCSKSLDEGFFCEHLLYQKAEIQDKAGNLKQFLKCGILGPRLSKLVGQG